MNGQGHLGDRKLRTAEMVTSGHPDKICDQLADSLLDACLRDDDQSRVAVEALAKSDHLVISGEVTTNANVDVDAIARRIWNSSVGSASAQQLIVVNNIQRQAADIAQGVDIGGAGDQGIMVGYASAETPEFMPIEYILARRLCEGLEHVRCSRELPWILPDGKAQVTMEGGCVTSVVIAAHHDESVVHPRVDDHGRTVKDLSKEARESIVELVIKPAIGNLLRRGPAPRLVINGTGAFTIGGPQADAGVVGRKIVIDAYGPRVPVGGGAYSGKDPTKVDRSAAYMARHIAKTIVSHGIAGASECTVTLAYAIGQSQPEMVTAFTDTRHDLSEWVRERWDLSPQAIIEYLGLRKPTGWCYQQTASFGHYGRDQFPWESVRQDF